MREATRAVVTSRHTYNLVDLPVQVAGKTGTAEFGERDKFGRLPYHEWFVGYTSGDPYHFNASRDGLSTRRRGVRLRRQHLGDISTEIVKYLHGAPLRGGLARFSHRHQKPRLCPSDPLQANQLLRHGQQPLIDATNR